MTNDMKCPFCQQEMICGGTICHYNPDCPIHDNPVPTEILELLDRTRKALEIAVDALKEISLLYSEKRNSPESVWAITAIDMAEYADNAIDKITALEQKEE